MKKLACRAVKTSAILVLIVILIIGCWITYLYFALPHRSVRPGKDIGIAGDIHALPLPEGFQENFEPHIAINPCDSNHIEVIAQYGIRFGMGGTNMYRWVTQDGGKSWKGMTLPAVTHGDYGVADPNVAVFSGGPIVFVELYSRGFSRKSSFHQLVIDATKKTLRKALKSKGAPFGALDERERVRILLGLAVITADGSKKGFNEPVIIESSLDTGRRQDKNWTAIDDYQESPFKGSVYVIYNSGEVDFTAKQLKDDGLRLAVSRDRGKSFVKMIDLTDTWTWAQVAVRPSGIVDVVYSQLSDISSTTPSTKLYHCSSKDGGQTFSPADLILPECEKQWCDQPALAVTLSGGLFACWVQSSMTAPARVYCSMFEDDLGWSSPMVLETDLDTNTEIAYPAIAASEAGLFVLAYKAEEKKTQVVLYGSTDGGLSFQSIKVLGERKFGSADFCASARNASDLGCRFNQLKGTFQPGDYVGLAAQGQRIAAAFVLTRDHNPLGFANTYAHILDLE
jgi:hypothetical protein